MKSIFTKISTFLLSLLLFLGCGGSLFSDNQCIYERFNCTKGQESVLGYCGYNGTDCENVTPPNYDGCAACGKHIWAYGGKEKYDCQPK
jgi:hypothetical protein